MSQEEIATFARVAPRISLFTPSKQSDGQLIVLCTWLGASRRALSKYLALYKSVAPEARILLVQADVNTLTSRYPKQRVLIQPAVSVVLGALAEVDSSVLPTSAAKTDAKPPKILLHSFSNGGTNTATQLLIEVRKRLKSPLPLVSLVFDSSPSKGTYWSSYNAIVLAMPRQLVFRILGPLLAHGILIILYTWIACGNENPASLQRRTMVDEDIVQGMDTPRVCYLYSEADRLCDWQDVREHADSLRDNGWDVKEVVFDGSKHCAHLAKDEASYTSAVEEMWRYTSLGERSKL